MRLRYGEKNELTHSRTTCNRRADFVPRTPDWTHTTFPSLEPLSYLLPEVWLRDMWSVSSLRTSKRMCGIYNEWAKFKDELLSGRLLITTQLRNIHERRGLLCEPEPRLIRWIDGHIGQRTRRYRACHCASVSSSRRLDSISVSSSSYSRCRSTSGVTNTQWTVRQGACVS